MRLFIRDRIRFAGKQLREHDVQLLGGLFIFIIQNKESVAGFDGNASLNSGINTKVVLSPGIVFIFRTSTERYVIKV